MTLGQIKKLLAEGEGFTAEFKKCTDELSSSVFETVCSFSNRYGGHIVLGVDDDGEVIGVKPSAVQKMKKNFANNLSNPQRFSPTLFLTMEEVNIDGKVILFSYVPVNSQIQSFGGHIYDRNEDGDFDITKSTQLIADLSIRKSLQFTERRIFPYAREEHLKLDELIPIVKRKAESKRPGHPWNGTRFFVQIGYADTLGSGVRNLYRYTKIYSGGEPELIEGDVFKTIVPIGMGGVVNSLVVSANIPTDDGNGTVNGIDGSVNGTVNGIDGSVNDTVNSSKILSAIIENPAITIEQIAKSSAISKRTVAREIKKLREQGKIRRVGSDKTGHWVL